MRFFRVSDVASLLAGPQRGAGFRRG
jgi:hypothetical protein